MTFTDEPSRRITRETHPNIIQAVRWIDEDSGTPSFIPGIGYVVMDPEGLQVPLRYSDEELQKIEKALADLDHVNPHPLDVDTLQDMAKNPRSSPQITDSEFYCFVCGEYTPMEAMRRSSSGLRLASEFLDDYFEEGWRTPHPPVPSPSPSPSLSPSSEEPES